MKYLLTVAGAGFLFAGCGSSSPSGPSGTTTPPVTAVRIAVSSSSDLMVIGTPETFTATVTRSDGSAATPGVGAVWNSDNAAVATADSASGLVQPRNAGQATIYVDYQGVRGTKLIRVVPNYQGRWAGTYSKLSCSEINSSGACAGFTGGGFSLTLTQTRDTVAGSLSLGGLALTVTGVMNTGGTLSLVGSGSVSVGSVSLNSWSTAISGNVMTGQFTFTVTTASPFAAATITSGLVNVVRQ